MEDKMFQCEDCTAEQQDEATKVRIVITTTSAVGVLISWAILVLLLTARAYKSFLQRLFMWIVLTVLLHDLCRTAAILYEFHRGSTTIEVLQDHGCEVLGFVTIWTFWCIYMLCVDLSFYLLMLVWIQTRPGNSAIVAKFRSSKLSRTLLEAFVILTTLLGPLVILWVPYVENQYGFGGGICGLKPSNETHTSNKDTIVISIFNYSNIELAGLAALISLVVVVITYFTLSVRIQHAKRAVKNILFFLMGIFAYVMAYNVLLVILKYVKRGYPVSVLSVCIAVAGKFVLLFGYILAFHFSKLCDPIKKITVKKQEAGQEQHQKSTKQDMNKEKEPLLSQQLPTRSTYFDVPYTGGFTSITDRDHTMA